MNLKKLYGLPSNEVYSIRAAIYKMIGLGYGSTELEDANQASTVALDFASQLIELLHAKGILTEQEILTMLNNQFSIYPNS